MLRAAQRFCRARLRVAGTLASEVLWICLEFLPVPVARADWRFEDHTAASGLVAFHGFTEETLSGAEWSSGGAAAGDYDGDGWLDLYVVGGSAAPNRLFRNRGDGTFDEVGRQAGVDLSGQISVGPSFVDFDGDGYLDLFVGALVCPQKTGFCDGVRTAQRGQIRLFRNLGNGTFEDVTERSGLRATRDTFSASWGDVDGDGDLDLFLTHWGEFRPPGSSEHLWRNNGDGTFTDISVPSGITAAYTFSTGEIGDLSFTGNFADLDSDGWLDLLVAGDFRQSKVFRNQGAGQFTEITDATISDENGMGAAVGDYDNDGDLDWFVSSIWDPDQDNRGNNWYVSGNRLYRNRGDGSFDDVTDLAGVREGYWGWAATFADFNNDGWLDLFHVNGWRSDDPNAHEFHADPARLFVNQGNGRFLEQAQALGLDDRGQGRAVVAFDADRDGDVDVFVGNIAGEARFYRNDAPPGNFFSVRLRGSGANREAIGARVWVRAGNLQQMRELRCGNNFVSQDPAEAHFGLGTAHRVDELRVRWPSGRVESWGPLPANAWVEVSEQTGLVSVEPRRSPTPVPSPTPPAVESPLVIATPTPSASPGSHPTLIASVTLSPTIEPASPTPSPVATASATATDGGLGRGDRGSCVGDCNGDGSVTVDEIIRLVNRIFGSPPAVCQAGAPDGEVHVAHVVCAVLHALQGCGGQQDRCGEQARG